MSIVRFLLGRRRAAREAASEAPSPPADPATTERLSALESALGKIFADRELYAGQIADLQQRDTEKDRRLIQTETQLANEVSERAKLVDSLTARVREISALETELRNVRERAEQSAEKQGKRIGDLESEVEYFRRERAVAAGVALRAEAQVYFLRSELVKRGVDPDEINRELNRIAAEQANTAA